MEEKEIAIDDIDFVDAVFAIPENAVEVLIKVKSYESGKLIGSEVTYNLKEIKKAVDLFQQTIEGEYPKYVITEEGKKWLEENYKDT